MERCFVITKDSQYSNALSLYWENEKAQKGFIKNYFKEKGIDGETYYMGGDGAINCAFEEYDKDDIYLCIEPTENNLFKFKKMLCKTNKHGLCRFKRASTIAKEFAQRCIDSKIVINLWAPRINDYFKSLQYGLLGCIQEGFKQDGVIYAKIQSENLKSDDTPEGFNEIKCSEYFKVKESFIS